MAKRVMVLEDEPVLVELLRDLLGLEGYDVILPAKPEASIEDMKSQLPDAMLIDVDLKGADGLDLLDQIRADPKLKDKVVLMTSGLDYRQESLDRGADHFLMKPYMPDDLVNILKEKFKS